jgi:CDP-diacylglycerol--serine O-phosphatidyltransferase
MLTSPIAAFHPSNALTYVSLLSAMAAMLAAMRGSAAAAGALIAVSVVADTFDGRFARRFSRTRAEQAFGVQLDSLSDAVAFGAAPCVCMTLLTPGASGWTQLASWTAVALFAACAITRLAFYNITRIETPGRFTGLPVPVAALVWASTLLLNPGPGPSSAVLLAAAAAMVAPLPFPRPSGPGLAAFAVWPLAVMAAHLARL